MTRRNSLNRSAWGWIRPDGSFVVDSQMEDEDHHCWQIGLGWPEAPREIEEAKRKGWKVCRFLVQPLGAPPEAGTLAAPITCMNKER